MDQLQLGEHPLGLRRRRLPILPAAVVATSRNVDEALEDHPKLQRHVTQPTPGNQAHVFNLLRVSRRLHDVYRTDGEAGQHEEHQPDTDVYHVLL